MVDLTARPYHYRVCRCPRCGQTLGSPEEQYCRHCACDMRSAAQHAAYARRQSGGNGRHPQATDGMLTVSEAYGVLGLPMTASVAEIKSGLHRAVAKWHPDRLEGMAEELRNWAAQKTARINAAYEVIRQSALVAQKR